MNKYINALVNFVKENDNWLELLKKEPYSLKTIKQCSWHPNWWMFVYNLFSSELTNDVVRGCRGTVLEINGKVVKIISAPYSKFFNYNDQNGKDIEDSINWDNAQIQLKCDGILVKTAKVDNRLYFFTNGSFDLNAPFEDALVFDEPATRNAKTYGDLLSYALSKVIKDEIHFDKEIGSFYTTGEFTNSIPNGSTIMLELISPRNRIICEYKETEVYIHGYRDEFGEEHNPREISFLSMFKFPELYNAHKYEELKEIIKTFKGNEKEGVVVVDYTTENTPRTKIKCDDYLRLKFARDTSCNTRLLFKSIMDNEYDDLISSVPTLLPKVEEIKSNINKLYKWFESKKLSIENKFNSQKEYVEWCKLNVDKSLFSYYMLMSSEFAFTKLEQKLKMLSCKKHGYEELLKAIEDINE